MASKGRVAVAIGEYVNETVLYCLFEGKTEDGCTWWLLVNT